MCNIGVWQIGKPLTKPRNCSQALSDGDIGVSVSTDNIRTFSPFIYVVLCIWGVLFCMSCGNLQLYLATCLKENVFVLHCCQERSVPFLLAKWSLYSVKTVSLFGTIPEPHHVVHSVLLNKAVWSYCWEGSTDSSFGGRAGHQHRVS